jgi:LAGLIDADG endonuclease
VVLDSRGYKSFKVSNVDFLITHIFPHFDKYPLITSKQLNYLSFKSIVLLLKQKEHLTIDGFNFITEI